MLKMPSSDSEILSPSNKSIKLLKWKVRKGTVVHKGSVLALYAEVGGSSETNLPCKLKAEEDGTVVKLEAEEGETVAVNGVVLRLHKAQAHQGCTHPTIMKDMCANCGADLREENGVLGDGRKKSAASVAMVHSIPELIVSQDLAMELGRQDESRLLRQRKLVLLVDLDQTLIHTTNDQIPSNLKGVKHFQLWTGTNYAWYHTRFRPFTEQFLETISKMYELHICTFGVRLYAHTIARLLDPDNKYFSHRILSRDECFDNLSKTPNLKALFPCGDEMVGIIDDREDVWSFAPNLIHVKAYRFFQGTADINAPPGLTKSEQDDVPIVHKTIDPSTDSGKLNDIVLDAEMFVSVADSIIDTSVEIESESSSVEKVDKSKDDSVQEDNIQTDQSGGVVDTSSQTNENGKVVEFRNKKAEHDKYTDCGHEKSNKEVEEENIEMKTSKSDKNISNVEEKEEIDNKVVQMVDKTHENLNVKVKLDKDKLSNEEEMKTETAGKKTDTQEKKTDMQEKKTEIKEKKTEKEDLEEIEWEDPDDYLLHLEEILTRIHTAYYNIYEQSLKGGPKDLPDLKNIIPYVKKKVLKGANIVFSGMFPVNMPPEKSKAYVTAKSLGANVQSEIVFPKSKKSHSSNVTTHLVAAKAGTVKYKNALKTRHINVVSGDWLWSCAERWEWVPEQLFLMFTKKDTKLENEPEIMEPNKSKKNFTGKGKRKLEAHDKNILKKVESEDEPPPKKGKLKLKTKNNKGKKDTKGEFSGSFNPLLSFSNEDIEFMDKEVDEMMAEGENDSDESDDERNDRLRKNVLGNLEESDSDSDSLAGDFPRGWKMRRKSLSPEHRNPAFESDGAKDDEEIDDETENELERYNKTVEAFAECDSDQDSNASGESIGSVDEEMAAAVEKEFLSSL